MARKETLPGDLAIREKTEKAVAREEYGVKECRCFCFTVGETRTGTSVYF